MWAGILQTAYTSVNSWNKNQTIRQSCREYWYGKTKYLQAQTLTKTQKKGNKPILKYPKSIPKKP
jgi:hypothetical protein